MMRIVIAPNAFKNSLAANEVAVALQTGLQQSALTCETILFPVGDGGDGTALLLTKHLNAIRFPFFVRDPLGREIESSFAITNDGVTAIIEMADASGLRLLKPSEYNPLLATSFGTGELLVAALDKGVKRIVLCVGGSATVDGGMGMMQALGVHFYQANNQALKQPASLAALTNIDWRGLDKRLLHVEILVLCDVENQLLGGHGAASVFGPQKGAATSDIKKLEAMLQQLRNLTLQETGIDMAQLKHGGAAGGIAAILHAFAGAKLVNGIDYFLSLSDFDTCLQQADLVITGEGSLDRQTLHGKGPFGVAKKAKEYQLPVIGIAGNIPLFRDENLSACFDVLLPINNGVSNMTKAIQETHNNLVRTGRMLGDLLALSITKLSS